MTSQSVPLTSQATQTTRAEGLAPALRYPFQGRGWFARLLPLTVVQLLPIVGQLMLIGYGVQVVRALVAGQADLPRVQWLRALGDGLRVAVAGFVYMIPILLTVLLLVTTSGGGGGGSLTIPVLFVFSLIVAPLGSRLQKQGSGAIQLIGKLLALMPLLAIVITLVTGVSSVMSAQNNPVRATPSAPDIGLPMLLGGSLLIFLILTATLVGAVRFAIENKGLFDAPGTAKLLLQHRRATGILLLNMVALMVIIGVATALGMLLLVVPGVFVLVAGSVAMWHLLAQFGMNIGIGRAQSSA